MKTIAQLLNHDFSKGALYLYDSNDNQIYFENSDGEWNKREYDSNGNEIYFEASNRYWEKREYDSNGNEIYFEDSYGFWYKREYDSNGNIIYYENSTGYWYKQEYNSNGNRIYCENSTGGIEDNRPNEITQDKVREAAEKAFNQARKQTSILGEKDVQMTDYLISPKYKTFEDYWNSKKQ